MAIINQRFFRSNVTGVINLPLNGNTTINLEPNISALAFPDSKSYRIVLRAEAPDGEIIHRSNVITMYGNAFLSIQATGGTKTEEGNWIVHAFTSSDNFNVTSLSLLPERNTIQYLAVGGGGAPAYRVLSLIQTESGGGAGGLLQGNIAVTADYVQNNTILVGGGGGGDGGQNGGNTVLFDSTPRSITALGGGGGNSPGGSGGGGSVVTIPGNSSGRPGTPGQGNPGFYGYATYSKSPTSESTYTYGGGGGGAGSGGPPSTPSSNGGNGRAISWVPESYGSPGPTAGRWFAAGGRGKTQYRTSASGIGSSFGTNGAGYGPGNGSASQSGIVIIRYPKG